MTESTDWREGIPRGVLDPLGPRGEVIETPVDRRWLWHIENFLAVAATTDHQRELAGKLRRYLHETCDHHWQHYGAGDDIPAHRQCLWCTEVDWLGAEPS